MKEYIGIFLIAIAVIGLILVFRRVLNKKGSVKGPIFWLISSASIGFVSDGFVSPILTNIQRGALSGSNEIIDTIFTIAFILLGGFVSLVIVAIWNGIFYGKWKATQGE